MEQPIIKVNQISKVYQKGAIGSGTFSRDLENSVKSFYSRLTARNKDETGELRKKKESIWSLKDVSFELYEGDAVGIIGRNGAGKSTLLKILSRVTGPTYGSIEGRGRIASLLEVGTGFHPELSGRENIFLNGAILGMKSFEIRKNFDEIVDFSGVEDFIDTPVKRYSSGMYVRLAFAVAAHLESEILIIDEVLAVGDSAFQKKCLGKMGSISKDQGRTVLFVSHNMQSIQNLCNKSLLLNNGELIRQGKTADIIQEYLNDQETYTSLELQKNRRGDGKIKFKNLRLIDPETNQVLNQITCGKNLLVEIDFIAKEGAPIKDLEISIGFNDQFGTRQTLISNELSGQILSRPNTENWTQRILVNKLSLALGNYSLNLFVSSKGCIHDWVMDAMPFYVEGDAYFENITMTLGSGKGNFYLDFNYL
jgi:lipopolysaccharide transport system ATP-binding protein